MNAAITRARRSALSIAFALLAAITSACGGGGDDDPTPGCVASAEVCNGADDDCDGIVDDGDPGGGAGCSTALVGVCAGGDVHCVSGGLTCVQRTAASAEICDGLDNDCDGAVDNGAASQCPGADTACGTRTCNIGACGFSYAAPGTLCAASGGAGTCNGAGVCVLP